MVRLTIPLIIAYLLNIADYIFTAYLVHCYGVEKSSVTLFNNIRVFGQGYQGYSGYKVNDGDTIMFESANLWSKYTSTSYETQSNADNASIVLNGVYKLEGYFGDMISRFEVYNSNFELVYKSSELSSELGHLV